MIDYNVFIIVWYTLQRIFVSSLWCYISKVLYPKGLREGGKGARGVPFQCIAIFRKRCATCKGGCRGKAKSAYIKLKISLLHDVDYTAAAREILMSFVL